MSAPPGQPVSAPPGQPISAPPGRPAPGAGPRGAAPPAPRGPAPFDPQAPARRADVIQCYRYILGREPEDQAVVGRHVARPVTVAALRARFLESEEFRASRFGRPASAPPTAPVAPDLAGTLADLAAAWTRLGEEAPHWSVRREPRFRPEALPAALPAFRATGRADRDLLEGVLARHGLDPAALPRLVEFGCGTGRATLHLAALCPEVTGLDLSAPHLAVAREEALRHGMDHVSFRLATPAAPMPAPPHDLWYSRHVLCWNPPALARALLERAFAGLPPGGVAVAGLALPGRAAVAAAPPGLHGLPQAALFAALDGAGMELLEFSPDAPPAGLEEAGLAWRLLVARRPRQACVAG